MAEAQLRKALPELSVRSAGLRALVGAPADAKAAELMVECGLDITAHRAQQITHILTNQADVILVMDHEQKLEIQHRYPMASGKVFLLGELGKFDIPDPYLRSRADFEKALALIKRGVEAWAPRILALA